MLTLALTACIWLDSRDVDERRAVTLYDLDADGVPADQDCDDRDDLLGAWSVNYQDGDGDGYGDPDRTREVCGTAEGYVPASGDCDDDDPTVNPGAQEVCDGVDRDCDGEVDQPVSDDVAVEVWPDLDGDSYGDEQVDPVLGCPSWEGYSDVPSDCDDTNADVWPDADPICGLDSNCSGAVTSCAPETDMVIDAAFAHVVEGVNGGALGRALAVGDLNGDGIGDLAIGAPADNYTDGAVWYVAGPIDDDVDLHHPEDGATYGAWDADNTRMTGAGAALHVGDVTGEDGIADVIVGGDNGGKTVSAYVVAGLPGSGELDSVGIPILTDFSVGTAVSAVATGDMDGDGRAELLLGFTDGGNSGLAYMLPGPITGPVNLNDAEAMEGSSPAAGFGAAIDIGDLNLDGYADVVVGSPMRYAGTAGRVEVFYGGSTRSEGGDTGPPAADFTIDGEESKYIGTSLKILDGENAFGNLAIGSHLAGSAGGRGRGAGQTNVGQVWLVPTEATGSISTSDVPASRGETDWEEYGRALFSPGDLDGNGMPDLLIGVPGSGSGLGAVEYWSDASGVGKPGGADVFISATQASGGSFGHAIAGGVDLSGDGIDEFVVSAPEADMGGGTVWVYDPAESTKSE